MSTSIIDQPISDDIIEQAIERGACQEGLEAARKSTWRTLPQQYQSWATYCLDLPQEVKDYLFSLGHTRTYWKEGKRHRDGDLPAVECPEGYKAYWKEGKRHRDGDLPAVICPDGYKAYWKEGKRHRDGDLPAIVWASGRKECYKEGKRYYPS